MTTDRRRRLAYLDEPIANRPKITSAVPAHIRPMVRGTPAFPVRCKVRLNAITRKPARVKTFMPKRISLVSKGICPRPNLARKRSMPDARVTYAVNSCTTDHALDAQPY